MIPATNLLGGYAKVIGDRYDRISPVCDITGRFAGIGQFAADGCRSHGIYRDNELGLSAQLVAIQVIGLGDCLGTSSILARNRIECLSLFHLVIPPEYALVWRNCRDCRH